MTTAIMLQPAPPRPAPLQVEVSRQRETTRVLVGGELDVASAPELARVLDPICTDRTARVEVDLRPLAFLDCAGVRPLRAAADRLARHGELVVLTGDRLQRLVLAEAGLGPTALRRATRHR